MTHAARTHDVIDRLHGTGAAGRRSGLRSDLVLAVRMEITASVGSVAVPKRIEPALCEPSCRRMEMRKGGEAWAW